MGIEERSGQRGGDLAGADRSGEDRAGVDRYGADVLSGDWRAAGRRKVTEVPAEPGLVVEVAEGGWTGAVVGADKATVALEDRLGRVRHFPFGLGFLIDGELVRLVRPVPAALPTPIRADGTRGPGPGLGRGAGPGRTASGSIAAPEARARVARASRILVEGRHDAELVERVWGDDLRIEGVVVEYLEGVDHLEAFLDEFRPAAGRRIGVLVDHLVAGSKESKIAEAVARSTHGAHTLVLGHPYVDVWQAVTPQALGITAWPEVPRGIEWKQGICEAFGWPHSDQADIAGAWRHILSKVHSYADLEPSLLGRVEELIDFVTD